jgi:hypothetical protein
MAFGQQISCGTQGTVSTPLRAEGFTEATGDVVITCQGGQALAPGLPVPLVNLTLYYTTTVTSRLLGAPSNAGQTPSEALLLIDDPNTNPNALQVGTGANQVQYGQTLGFLPCTTYLTGCAQTAGPTVSGFTTAIPGNNVYQGVTAGNSVTFYGIPVLPPSTVGSRVYRVTNVRVNATQGGITAGTQPIQAYISVSTPSSLPISNAYPIVGYVQPGLKAAVKGNTSFNQCVSQTTASTGTSLTFTELFGSAFKTRVFAQSTAAGAGQGTGANQNVPGGIYASESNFVYGGFTGTGTAAGLADYGTRLRATFNNVPSGVHVFVTSSNVNANTMPYPALLGGSGNNTASYAVIVGSETASDGTGFVPTSYTATSSDATEVTINGGTGTAVWEVVNTVPTSTETFSFGVSISYTAATSTNSPLPGTATVTLTYAPAPPAFANQDGGNASRTLSIPRFSSGNTPFSGTVFTINVCRTILLYPYITNQGGFDTGLTVANTSQDPFTTGGNATGAQNGACTFTYYGGTTAAPTTPPAATNTGNIAAGTVWAQTLGALAPTFQGYAFAICNFQYAHGFAFISDVGARNLAMGYLALIIPDPGTFVTGNGVRIATPPCQGITGCTASGEQDSH